MPVDKFGRMSDTKTKDTGLSLTYINNNYIRSDGTTPVSGSINMRSNTLYNVPDPVNPQDVATKEYVDYVGRKAKHLIIVHAKYCCVEKFDEYPFKFSGGDFEACDEFIENKVIFAKGSTTGFLMPHTGNSKKIVTEAIVYVNINDLNTYFIKTLEKDNAGVDLIKILTEERFFKKVVKIF